MDRHIMSSDAIWTDSQISLNNATSDFFCNLINISEIDIFTAPATFFLNMS